MAVMGKAGDNKKKSKNEARTKIRRTVSSYTDPPSPELKWKVGEESGMSGRRLNKVR